MVQFFEQPILNSPYAYPARHWEFDAEKQPTNRILPHRRSADFISPIPQPKGQRGKGKQMGLEFEGGFTADDQLYNVTAQINTLREQVAAWRALPNPRDWKVTPVTARLLQHWRHHDFQGVRPFFCQIEAVETAIWLAEVAPRLGKRGQDFLDVIRAANDLSNPELLRIALKLATGAGKTTVMAMLIAWQTVNAVRSPHSERFTRGFLLIAPGITIRDRLRVLQPNDPDSYYASRELVPQDMLADIARAKIVITNYHAFKLRERLNLAAGGRALLQGRGPALQTLETEGEMLRRVMPDLMGIKNILVINDEAHHCYREKPADPHAETTVLKGEEREEAQRNNEAARLWIAGIETVKRKLGVRMVYDLSATPFFLHGSGYREGTLFPWTVSDFSLMDAIESGIVKLPRVPVADNLPSGEMPRFRNLWAHIRDRMPKAGRGKTAKPLDPLSLPTELQTALDALYGHYAKTFAAWETAGIAVPPVFIVVCNNTATSKLVYDYISGFQRRSDDGTSETFNAGRLALFRNFDEYGNALSRPRTLLIDSEQLESGDALHPDFRAMAAHEIERFRREIVERSGNLAAGEHISDQELLREVMNTVGKVDRLGEQVRCVVSVSMLNEGWDAQTVTHILGIRAFGTQLLCEQVVGRALRRQSYELNDQGLFDVEYADVLGIPFDFTAKQPPTMPQPIKPAETVRVYAVCPDRDALEIRFPRVTGYRVELPNERLAASFNADSVLELTPRMVGPSITRNEGIVGEGVDLTVEHLQNTRHSTIIFELTKHLLYTKFRDSDSDPKLHLFGQLKLIVRQWLDGGYLRCTGNTHTAQVLYQEIADQACERIKAAITATMPADRPIKAVLDAYTPTGSSSFVSFATSKPSRWRTDSRRSQLNLVVCDSEWEKEFCRVVERNPHVHAYVKNQGLGLEVPYLVGATPHLYLPDFVVQLDDGRTRDGQPDWLNLIVEIKGYRGENAKDKANTMRSLWVPGVNNLTEYGRWAFAEFTEVFEIQTEFDRLVAGLVAG